MTILLRSLSNKPCLPAAAPCALLISCLALCSLSVFLFPLNHDASWILDIARQVRSGANLYVDIIELNPPLIVWINIPVSALSDILGTPVGLSFRITTLTLCLISISFSAKTLHGKIDKNLEWPLLFIACYALIGAAGYDFGQREHLTVILCLPYIAIATLRIQGIHTPKTFDVAAAIFAAIGFLIKPYFLLVPLSVEILVARTTRRWLDESAYIIATASFVYAILIFKYTPEYINLAKMVSTVYGIGYLGNEFLDFLYVPNFQIASILIFITFSTSRALPIHFQAVFVAALSFACAALIQNKAWSYHWYPALAFSWILFCVAVTKLTTSNNEKQPSTNVLGGLMLIFSATALFSAPGKGYAENPAPKLLTPVIKELGGGPVMIFSNSLRVSYPLVTQTGIGSSSRLPTVVLLSASINSKNTDFENYLRKIIIEDMRKIPPHILIVEMEPRGMTQPFDFITYFSQDPIFTEELQDFKKSRRIGQFQFFQRVNTSSH